MTNAITYVETTTAVMTVGILAASLAILSALI